MKPHGQERYSTHMLEQGSESEETTPEEPPLPGTSLRKGSSLEANPRIWGRGRGNILGLCKSSAFKTVKKSGDQGHGKSDEYSSESSIENVSKEVHKMHLGKRQEIPVRMETPRSRLRSSSPEKYAPKDRSTTRPSLHSSEKLVPKERRLATAKSAHTEKPRSRSSSSSPEKFAPKDRSTTRPSLHSSEKLVPKERRLATAKSALTERPRSRSSSPEKFAPKERPTSRPSLHSSEKLVLKERRLATAKSAHTVRPRSRSSSPEKFAPEERPTSRPSLHSSEKLVPKERRLATAKSAHTEKPRSRSSSSSPEKFAPKDRSTRPSLHSSEKLVPKERRLATAKSAHTVRPRSRSSSPEKFAPKERPTSRPSLHSSEKLVPKERRLTTAKSAHTERPTSRPSLPSSESLAVRERRPATAKSVQAERLEETVDEFTLKKKRVNHLLTNYVRLQTDSDLSVYEYEVTFSPEVEFKNFRFRLLYEHFTGKKDILCYDGGSKLFTPKRITDEVEEFVVHHPVSKNKIIMGVKLKKKAESKDCAVVYNTLFNNCSRILKFTRFGNKYFDAEEAVDIPQHKLEIWPGYVTAVDDFDGGIQLRCDINHRVLRTETVLEVLQSFSRRGPEYVKAMALRDLIGQCVMTRYNNNLYRIDDIDWLKTPLSTFTLKNGEKISFIEYYKRQYNIEITDMKQPLLISMAKDGRGGKKNIICLVPEICYMTGLNDRMRADFKVMKDIARYTRITPSQRIYAFKKFLGNMKRNEEIQGLLNKWGLRIMDDFVQVKAKNLEPESLVFANSTSFKTVNYDWMKSLRDLNVYRSVDIKNWILVYPLRNRHVADDFTTIITKIGPGLGVVIESPTKVSLTDDRVETYISSLKQNIKSHTQIVVCICPTAREDRYNAIKKLCCKEIPIPSQVVNVVTLSREDRIRSVVQNIALQMNHKIGGAGWAIQIPFNRTMVCGVDTYHEKNHAAKSVGAFVASTSNDCTEWFSRTNFQGPKEELISGLVNAFTSALLFYYKKNGAFPDHIVVFRDGVSDGQLDICLEFEVPQLLNVFSVVAKNDYRPNFLYVIVQKRIATKLFKKMDEGIENPRPGGIVDSIITKKDYVNFYLVSQLVRSGTASPTHYIVLYDNSNTNLDYIQRLTYKFCHLYYNWPGTIRVPAPCQYAHKLAYLVGQNIKCMPDKSLQDKLFYL